ILFMVSFLVFLRNWTLFSIVFIYNLFTVSKKKINVILSIYKCLSWNNFTEKKFNRFRTDDINESTHSTQLAKIS
ncbi:hypothetical protein QL818_20260, partial [Bacillus altitudinis]|uniref:hypothetical protein n=1 Tax=Bacillus altitudinis TaxID=293387 RepID=UPI0024A8D859